MIHHLDIGTNPSNRKAQTLALIKKGVIQWGGYRPGKIYGRLSCTSGKRMKVANRVFFTSIQEAIEAGYRPCAHCMPREYQKWKQSK
ncbi:Ada metal-binding domain-containing protein [Paraflavitalea speifideaquila]|uniref:Ada metal-binding domain-containing protein n=1 Tax=Paraflavitalea speifideaquila TaxID=3076558 RepID=UPI0028E9BC46|nr:Ada metal-binding domain-containing protein [Paraflavitalea speifideiaquila]